MSPEPPPFTTSDSAGITIVESTRPLHPGRLAVDTTAAIDIGGRAAGPASEFPAPVTVVRLRDGRIAAAGWATHSLRFFDSSGRFLDSVGREGSGPGEFQALGWLYRAPGDTLLTYEPTNRRVQRFDPNGGFLTLAPLPPLPDSGRSGLTDVLADGSLLVSASRAIAGRADQDIEPTVTRYFRQDRLTGAARPLFERPGVTYIRHPVNPRWYYGLVLFSAVPLVEPASDGIAAMSSDRIAITRYDLAGRVTRIQRAALVGRRVTDDLFDQALDEAVQSSPAEWRAAIGDRLRRAPRSENAPVASVLVVGDDGRIWVQHFGTPIQDAGPSATVFDRDGRWETDLTLPDGFLLKQAGPDWILGTRADDDGFTHILLYHLTRPVSQITGRPRLGLYIARPRPRRPGRPTSPQERAVMFGMPITIRGAHLA